MGWMGWRLKLLIWPVESTSNGSCRTLELSGWVDFRRGRTRCTFKSKSRLKKGVKSRFFSDAMCYPLFEVTEP